MEGKGRAVILDVIFSPPKPSVKSSEESASDDELRALELQTEDLKSDRSILNQQSATLDTYSTTVRPGVADASVLQSFLQLYKTQRQAIFTELQKVNQELQKAEDAMRAIQKARSIDEAGKRRKAQVTVIVSADAGGQAELTLKYGMLPYPS